MNSPVGRTYLTRFALLFGGRLVGAVAMFFATLLIARYFGADALAEFALLVSAMGILSVFLGAGFNRVGGIFSAAYAAKRQLPRLKGFLFTGSGHIIAGSVAVLVLVGILAAFPTAGLPEVTLRSGLLVIAGAAAIAALYLCGSIMVGLGQQPRGLLPDTLIRPLLFFVILVVLTRTAEQDVVSSVAMAYVATIWLALVLALILSRRRWLAIAANKAEFQHRVWRRAAYPWAAISLTWDYLIEVIILVAGLLAQRHEVAILYVCFRFRVLAGFGMRSILMLFLPEITGFKVEGKVAQMKRRLLQVNLLSCAYVAGVLVAFALVGRWLLGLFGDDIASGYAVLMIVGLALVPAAVFGPAPHILAIHNMHMISALVMTGGW